MAFIDGTVIGTARPSGDMEQRVVYNGHKRKHKMKFKAVTSPDWFIVHSYASLEGRRHEWTMYVSSELEESLQEPCTQVVPDTACIVTLDKEAGGCSKYLIKEKISPYQYALNKSMSASRITVAWIFNELKY